MTSPISDILQKYGERCFIEGYEGSDEAGISIEEAEQALTALLEAAIQPVEAKARAVQSDKAMLAITEIRRNLGIPTEPTT